MQDNPPPQKASLDAALAMLEPLAGLLLSRELRYAQAEDLLKAAFVLASARSFAAQGKLPTVSNISVTTGIRRREVKRLLEAPAATVAQRPSAAVQARLRWATDPTYLDTAGQPRRLPRSGAAGEASFAGLAAAVSKDMHARALLDEMLRVGSVQVDGDHVVLLQREYAPSRSADELMRIAGANVGDHLSAVLMNMLSNPPPLLERAIFVGGLTQASARHATDLARDAWRDVLGGLRQNLQSLSDLDAAAPDNQWRMRLGLYTYFAPEERPPPPVASAPRRAKASGIAKTDNTGHGKAATVKPPGRGPVARKAKGSKE
ncbi:MAG: hypothetical protein AD742_14535 [Methylibium sp. NZG]|nr:MAG: hypothetical protein AD742_14535 [Methylibium sp. NZG]